MSKRKKKKLRDPPQSFTEYLQQPGEDPYVDGVARCVAMLLEGLAHAAATIVRTVKSVLSSTRKRRG